MVLEQIALLGIAGVDAYLVSTYLNSKRQAGERARALSYGGVQQQPVQTAGSASLQPPAAASGDSVILSDRLAAIKSAVGETKFADEVLPYELGALPSTSLAENARFEESSEEFVSDSSTVVESTSTRSSTVTESSSLSVEEKFESHDRKIQDLSSEFAVLEYRIAEVERMLGVEKPAEKKAEQIVIPFKPVIVQPVVVEKKVATAKKHAKKNAAKKKAKARKKTAKKNVKKVAKKSAKRVSRKVTKKVAKKAVKKSVTITAKKAAPRKAARKKVRGHKRSNARRQTQRVEVVIKNQAAKKRKAKPRKARRAKKGRVEVVFKAAKGTVVKKTAKSGSNRVEITVAGKRGPAKKAAKAKKKASPRKQAARSSSSSNKVEVVVKTASGKKVAVKKKRATKKAANRVEVVLKEPSQKVEVVPVQSEKPAEKKPSEKKDANSKDHMDIEWKGSTIKLYSGESKD